MHSLQIPSSCSLLILIPNEVSDQFEGSRNRQQVPHRHPILTTGQLLPGAFFCRLNEVATVRHTFPRHQYLPHNATGQATYPSCHNVRPSEGVSTRRCRLGGHRRRSPPQLLNAHGPLGLTGPLGAEGHNFVVTRHDISCILEN